MDDGSGTTRTATSAKTALATEELGVWYDDTHAVRGVSMEIPENQVTAIIGPSGCGKSSFLRSLNRMNDLIPAARTEGRVLYRGLDIYDPKVNETAVRRAIGMVFQKPNPFPKSIHENIAYGLRLGGDLSGEDIDDRVHEALEAAHLLKEVEDRLDKPGTALSGGQQQRLCIARAIAVRPDVILMDEPCSALDPVATSAIEDLIAELKEDYTVVIVTHNMQQAARVSDRTAFFHLGELIEYGPTDKLFENPDVQLTEDYITGRFG